MVTKYLPLKGGFIRERNAYLRGAEAKCNSKYRIYMVSSCSPFQPLLSIMIIIINIIVTEL
jgi:hypothetical protein